MATRPSNDSMTAPRSGTATSRPSRSPSANESLVDSPSVHSETPETPPNSPVNSPVNGEEIREQTSSVVDTGVRDKEEYLESIQKHANDPQNVHDTQIVKSLSIKYKRLMELHNAYNKDAYREISEAGIPPAEFKVAKINRCMDEFREYARDYISSGLRNGNFKQDIANEIIKKISAVMKEILKARAIVSLTSNNEIVREDWIFAIIWEHINTTSNTEIQGNLRESFISQIIDCAQKNNNRAAFMALQLLGLIPPDMVGDYAVVCINGRVGRMLSSMTLIDSDPILGAPEKDEAEIANEIYTKVFKLLEDELNKQPELKKLYTGGSDDIEVVSGIDTMKTGIKDVIIKEYSELVPATKLTDILNKAIAGI